MAILRAEGKEHPIHRRRNTATRRESSSKLSVFELAGETGEALETFAGRVERLTARRRVRAGGRMTVKGSTSGTTTAAELPTSKAFVLQLTSETGETLETFAGRVEHLPTGRRVRFGEMKEFLAALRQLLKETGNR